MKAPRGGVRGAGVTGAGVESELLAPPARQEAARLEGVVPPLNASSLAANSMSSLDTTPPSKPSGGTFCSLAHTCTLLQRLFPLRRKHEQRCTSFLSQQHEQLRHVTSQQTQWRHVLSPPSHPYPPQSSFPPSRRMHEQRCTSFLSPNSISSSDATPPSKPGRRCVLFPSSHPYPPPISIPIAQA